MMIKRSMWMRFKVEMDGVVYGKREKIMASACLASYCLNPLG